MIDFDNSYARLPDRFYARLDPGPVSAPSLIALNDPLAESLGLDSRWLRSEAGVAMLAGNAMPEGAEPIAMAYAGQQFGNWVPQLGDGRALLLGETTGRDGLRRDIQLKGSGPTPFSRRGDGRAWLGPVLREYIVSEAMAALGIPTTRALAAVATGDIVHREQELPGAILTRVARGHIRVGTFQYFAIRRDHEALEKLAAYALERLYPDRVTDGDAAKELLHAVIEAQASLVAHWMGVGFIHGVMNTDNVSIAGETIDYGPCAFMDAYHPDKVFSSIDEMGRYAYSNQPRIAHWNLVQFAQSLLPILAETEDEQIAIAQAAVDAFPAHYERQYRTVMANKLGFGEPRAGDEEIAEALLAIMADEKMDFTLTFRAIGENGFRDRFIDLDRVDTWLAKWRARLKVENASAEEAASRAKQANPAFIPRNHRVDQAIRAALEGDFDPFHRLNRVLQNPFEDQPEDSELLATPETGEEVRYTFCGT